MADLTSEEQAQLNAGMLDDLAEMLDGKSPFPEAIAFEQIRSDIRGTGRKCASPPPAPPQAGTEGAG